MTLAMRKERIRRGWTQDDVAKQVNLTLTAIQKIETGQRYPSYPVLIQLEDLFGMSHRQLFAVVNDKPISQTNDNIERS